jgi:hypothetical protein
VPQEIVEAPLKPVDRGLQSTAAPTSAFQVQIASGGDVTVYNFAMAHLRTIGGVDSAAPQQINPGGTSYVLVSYRGGIGSLAAAPPAQPPVVNQTGSREE